MAGTKGTNGKWPGARLASRIAVMGAFLLTMGGCDRLLDVDLPGDVLAEDLDDPSMASLMVLSAIGDFECAFSAYVLSTAVYTEEVLDSSPWIALWSWAARQDAAVRGYGSVGCGSFTSSALWRPLQTARFQAETAIDKIPDFPDAAVPNKNLLLAQANAYAGYSYTLLSEAFCEMTWDGGPRRTREEGFREGEARFTTALQHADQVSGANAALANQIRNMVLVGRARARLNLGDGSGAVADAERVEEGFVGRVSRDAAIGRLYNSIFEPNQQSFDITIPPWLYDVEVDGVPDPRIPVEDQGRLGRSGNLPLWYQRKYNSRDTDLPLASWREAQLIIAEVQGGQEAVAIINRLRATHGLPQFASSDAAEIREQVQEERFRELWLQGHRLGDMLRWGLEFPTGSNLNGVAYGDYTCVPLPDAEVFNNPNL